MFNPLVNNNSLEVNYVLQNAPVKPSVSLRNNWTRGTRSWLMRMGSVMQFLNKILALTHPELYHAGKTALGILQQGKDMNNYTQPWKSVFTGVVVISNQKTPEHWDSKGHLSWYDLVLSVGTYQNAWFKTPDLGAQFLYKPGTVILLCGKLLTHEVPGWDKGDRVCHAYFMRNTVFSRLGALYASIGWSTMHKMKDTFGAIPEKLHKFF